MRLQFKIAIKFIFNNIAEHLAILLTIVIGLAVQLFVVSLAFTLSNFIDDIQTHGKDHYYISPQLKETTIRYHGLTDEELIEESNGILKTLVYTGLNLTNIQLDNGRSAKFQLQMFNSVEGFEMFDIEERLIEGGRLPTKEGELVVIDTFAKREGVKLGDKVLYDHVLIEYEYEIVGIFKTTRYDFSADSYYGYSYVPPYFGDGRLGALYLEINDPGK